MPSDFTKRAGIDKEKGMSKLVMLCNRHFRSQMIYQKVGGDESRRLIWYHFMSCFESSEFCGESGAHMNVIDMEIAKKPVDGEMWPISVTLNISLDEYRLLRRKKRFAVGMSWVKSKPNTPERMPSFREIKS